MLTIDEICDKLISRYDPDFVVELLDISTQDLVDMFAHKIEERYDQLNEEFEDE